MNRRVHALLNAPLRDIPAQAKLLESLGFDGAVAAELEHDVFLPLMLAAEHTTRLQLSSGIAVAFARNPMLLATLGHELNSFSAGRFTLGLGSQIQAHITRRFSMPWSDPAKRMREMVQAIRAIFADWYDGQKLNFQGEYYTHTLMTPMFRPRDTQHGKPRITIAAVGPLMTQVAGAIADGVILHSFTNEAYIRAHTLTSLRAGQQATGNAGADFRIFYSPFIVTGSTAEQFSLARDSVARRIAFYASTPAYHAVLDQHGWGDLQPRLQTMTRENRWDEMGKLITPAILEKFAVVGEPSSIVKQLLQRYGDFVTDWVLGGEVVPIETLAEIGSLLKQA
jgi:probable F420-dependent oxidoreductase